MEYAPNASEAVIAFSAHRNRWEQADFEIYPAYLSTVEGPLPLLRHLRLSFHETPISSIITFSDAPMLRSAALDFCAAENVVLPWAQLTSLKLSWVVPEEWVPLLQQTVNLVHCNLELANCQGLGGFNDQPADIRLLCLESLTFTIEGEVDSCLETFVVPALHRLEVPESFLEPHPIETLSSFISKSACKLHKVRITGARKVPMDSYRKTFSSIPDLSFECEDTADDSDSEALCSDSDS
ncbi:hypothetical protein C8R47DRAFT_80795 [Mycena vitilis]|nr:hypothetical protein C8R47DRAFT_80795 [Mycena vitilis]